MPGVLLCFLASQAHRRVLLWRSARQELQGLPWVGSYSVVQCVMCLMGQPLYCSAANAGMWGERGYGDGSTPYTLLRSISFFHGYGAFLHGHFPPPSPPSHPLALSLCSHQQPVPWDSSTISKLHLPVAVPSRGPASLSRVCMAVVRTVWFSFHLGCHRSAVSLLNVSPLTQTIVPM